MIEKYYKRNQTIRLFKHQAASFFKSKIQCFVKRLPKNAFVLDVGCGNESVYYVKTLRRDCFYTGIDVSDYNQSKASKSLMDEYTITSAEKFNDEIGKFEEKFDAVISHHNLEHCYDMENNLFFLIRSLKKGGRLFLKFPCEESISFPSRKGTLNFFDDPTHTTFPPEYSRILYLLNMHGVKIEYCVKRSRPLILAFVGMLLEPLSKHLDKVFPCTWEYYGFETVIIARKKTLYSR